MISLSRIFIKKSAELTKQHAVVFYWGDTHFGGCHYLILRSGKILKVYQQQHLKSAYFPAFWSNQRFPIQKYQVTQNKVHHLLAILYLIFEVNNTQVSYVIQCIVVNKVQFNRVLFWKCLSEKNILNCAVIWQTARFEISIKIVQLWMFSDI